MTSCEAVSSDSCRVQESLASRVCRGDGALELSVFQLQANAELASYLSGFGSVLNFELFGPSSSSGVVMVMAALTVWFLSIRCSSVVLMPRLILIA